jgi:hypothetical protein
MIPPSLSVGRVDNFSFDQVCRTALLFRVAECSIGMSTYNIPMPRKTNPMRPKVIRLALNQSVADYLHAIALTGVHGNVDTDVAKKYIGDGIAQAIRDRLVPKRKSEVPYETDDESQKG